MLVIASKKWPIPENLPRLLLCNQITDWDPGKSETELELQKPFENSIANNWKEAGWGWENPATCNEEDEIKQRGATGSLQTVSKKCLL